MSRIDQAYQALFTITILILLIFMFLCFIRALRGPKVADRIVSVNMMGTMTIMIIGILSAYLKESYLLDISMIYAMISFLSVITLTKVYIGAYRQKKDREKKQQEKEERVSRKKERAVKNRESQEQEV
ncbi:MAG: cation:proton antiporter [Lachnospiraceae bacterium]|nr:cation:proton antiporter [Lachnospiraceae bacterium]